MVIRLSFEGGLLAMKVSIAVNYNVCVRIGNMFSIDNIETRQAQ